MHHFISNFILIWTMLSKFEWQQIRKQNMNNFGINNGLFLLIRSSKTTIFYSVFCCWKWRKKGDFCCPCLAAHSPKLRVTRPAVQLCAVGAFDTSQLRNDLSQSETCKQLAGRRVCVGRGRGSRHFLFRLSCRLRVRITNWHTDEPLSPIKELHAECLPFTCKL